MSTRPTLTAAPLLKARQAATSPLHWAWLLPVSGRVLVVGLLLGTGLLGGCRGQAPTADTPEPVATPTPSAPIPTPTVPVPTPTPTPTDSPTPSEPITTAPTPAPTPPTAMAPNTAQNTATLPNPFIKQWEPQSNVLLAFGAMTITPDQVKWTKGQSSPYTVISTDGGYLLKLEATPNFYDTPYSYIKLIPKTDANGGFNSIDVAFYENLDQTQRDEYVMFGGYFVN